MDGLDREEEKRRQNNGGDDASWTIKHRAYARVGLLGNPSDVYYGRVISFTIGNFWATVRLRPSDHLVIQPHPYHDFVQFPSIDSLVRDLIRVEVRPNLILKAEGELGIVAGLQDRVVQVYGGLVYMDFSKENMDTLGHGLYTSMDTSLLPQLHLIYAENPSDSGKVHSSVQKRWLDGDEFIISSMKQVANLAVEGQKSLLEKGYTRLAELMNRNFDLRRSMFSDDALGSMNIAMVEVARSVGAASKFTGSGGAVIAFCPGGPSQVKRLEEACQSANFVIQPAVVVPCLLNDEDFKMLSR